MCVKTTIERRKIENIASSELNAKIFSRKGRSEFRRERFLSLLASHMIYP
jgi:hypothetical protein